MKKEIKKHIIYHDLVEAMGEKGCPICLIVRQASKQYLAAILNEGVNDPPLRRKLRDSMGFCNRHAWELRSLGDSLATAILYKDLMDRLAQNLKTGLEESRECAACLSVASTEANHVAAFSKYIFEQEFEEQYRSSFGLCRPHLMEVLRAAKDERSHSIIRDKEAHKLKELSDQLSEYIRKKDYRFAHEEQGEERDSWIRAVEKLSGGQL